MNSRAIDRLVAEKVLKQETRVRWVVTKKKYEYKFYNVNGGETWLPLPEFSSDIKEAWYVLKEFYYKISTDVSDNVTVELMFKEDEDTEIYSYKTKFVALAICLAALKAHGINIEI
jgi:hypothetical protein